MKRKNTERAFVLSMILALLTATAVSGVLLALQRMENTMQPKQYTLFSLEKLPDDRMTMTALGEEYEMDFSGVRNFEKKLSRLTKKAAPGTQIFLDAMTEIVNALSRMFASV